MKLISPLDERHVMSRSDTFPVVHTVLSQDALLERITSSYGLSPSLTCQLVRPGLNDTYLLASDQPRYIVRVYGTVWRFRSEIRYELGLLRHLSAKGVPVSVPIPDAEGNLLSAVRAPEGVRFVALFSYAAGEPLSWQKERHGYLAGRLAATIHAAADDFVSPHARSGVDLAYLIDRPLSAIRPFLMHRPRDARYVEGLALRLRARTTQLASNLDWGPCHGDLGAKNIHIDEDGSVTAFDFDLCGPGWRVYDFGPAYRASDHGRSRIWTAFLRGYAEERPLADADLAAVPLFRALRHFRMLGEFATHADNWGTLTLDDPSLDHWLSSFRGWDEEGEWAREDRAETPKGRERGLPDETNQEPLIDTAPGRRVVRASEPVIGREPSPVRLPAVYSIVSPEGLLRFIARTFSVGTLVKCELLRRGLHDTYLVTARDACYVARVHPVGKRSASELAYEIELLRQLRRRELLVPEPIPARDGADIQFLSAPEGIRPLVLFSRFPSRPLSWDSPEECYLAGQVLARIHTASDDFVSGHERFHLDEHYLIEQPADAVGRHLTHRPADLEYLTAFAGRMKARMQAAATGGGLDWGPCHGQFAIDTVGVSDSGSPTVPDFDLSGPGWRAYDFSLVSWADSDDGRGSHLDPFVTGYTEIRPLRAVDHETFPLFCAARRLWSLGIVAANADEWGSRRINEQSINGELAFFREWEAAHEAHSRSASAEAAHSQAATT